MEEADLARDARLFDFLVLVREERARGVLRPLAEYQARFPGLEAEVAGELRRLERGSAVARQAEQRQLPGLQLLRLLGRGGQGEVWLAQDLALPRQVAVKVLRSPFGAPSPQRLERLRREVDALARLDHPHIASVLTARLDHDPPFVAMRLVNGRTLAEHVAERLADAGRRAPSDAPRLCAPDQRAALDRLLLVFEKLALALHAAHQSGLVHRDVKPANVMLDERGEPVLLDFGLARATDADTDRLTLSHEMFGTPAYLAPERVQRPGDPARPAEDVWALGVTLYEAVTLRRPFAAPSPDLLLRAVCTDPLPDARSFNPALPPELSVVLATALERDVGRRYASAAALAEDLRRVRERRPVLAHAPGPVLRVRRWGQRHPALASVLVLLGLGLFGSGAAVLRLQHEQELSQLALRQLSGQIQASRARDLIASDPNTALRDALEAHRLAPGYDSRNALYAALLAARGSACVYLGYGPGRDLDAAHELFAGISDTGELDAWSFAQRRFLLRQPAGSAAWTAVGLAEDGRLLAAGRADGATLLFDLAQPGAAPRVLTGPPVRLRLVRPSHDAQRLATAADDGSVGLWTLGSEPPARIECGRCTPARGLAFSPDDRTLLAWPGTPDGVAASTDPPVADGSLHTWAADSGAPGVAPAGHAGAVRAAGFSPDGRLILSAGSDGTARTWDALTGEPRLVLQHAGAVQGFDVSPDGRLLATASDPGDPVLDRGSGLRLYELHDGTLLRELHGHEARAVTGVRFRPDGRVLASASYDGTARLWSVPDGEPLMVLRTSARTGRDLFWFEEGQRLAVLQSQAVWVFDVGQQPDQLRLVASDAVVRMAFDARGERLAVATADGRVALRDARSGEPLWSVPAHEQPVTDVLLSADGSRVASASLDGRVVLLDAVSGAVLDRIEVGEPLRRLVARGAGGVALGERAAFLVDFAGGRPAVALPASAARLQCLAVSPDGRLVATGGDDALIVIHDVDAGSIVRLDAAAEGPVPGRPWSVRALRFTAEGRRLLAGGEANGLLVCDPVAGVVAAHLASAAGQIGQIGQIEVAPDGSAAFVTSLWGSTAAVVPLDGSPGPQEYRLIAGRITTLSVASATGQAVVGSTDGQVRLWQLDGLQPWAQFRAQDGVVAQVLFAPDGRQFATAGADGIVRTWPADPLAAAQARIARLDAASFPVPDPAPTR